MRQVGFEFKTWGGRRKGAGRKRVAERARVAHRVRPILKRRFPVHVTMRLLPGFESLRRGRVLRVLKKVFVAAAKENFWVVHYSVQSNHLHFIIEAEDGRALSRGMRGLNVRMAKALNQVMGRTSGRVFADRYHAVILQSPLQTRRTVRYVLRNFEHHIGRELAAEWRDEFASADAPVARPRTWLLISTSGLHHQDIRRPIPRPH